MPTSIVVTSAANAELLEVPELSNSDGSNDSNDCTGSNGSTGSKLDLVPLPASSTATGVGAIVGRTDGAVVGRTDGAVVVCEGCSDGADVGRACGGGPAAVGAATTRTSSRMISNNDRAIWRSRTFSRPAVMNPLYRPIRFQHTTMRLATNTDAIKTSASV